MSSVRRQQSDTSETVERTNERDLHGSSVMDIGSHVYDDVSVVAKDNYMGLSGREDSSSYTSFMIRHTMQGLRRICNIGGSISIIIPPTAFVKSMSSTTFLFTPFGSNLLFVTSRIRGVILLLL